MTSRRSQHEMTSTQNADDDNDIDVGPAAAEDLDDDLAGASDLDATLANVDDLYAGLADDNGLDEISARARWHWRTRRGLGGLAAWADSVRTLRLGWLGADSTASTRLRWTTTASIQARRRGWPRRGPRRRGEGEAGKLNDLEVDLLDDSGLEGALTDADGLEMDLTDTAKWKVGYHR